MGRIQKKKDPGKKKIQRQAKAKAEPIPAKGGGGAVAAKPVSVMKKSAGTDKPKAAMQDQSVVQKSIQFLREVKIELKKVTWPTRKQTMGSTAVVIVLVIIIGLFLGVVDISLSNLIRMVLP
jgi:preprotein translocase subunit SecE